MKHHLSTGTALLGLVTTLAFADDPPQPPRDHVDTTVVGSNSGATDSNGHLQAATLENPHHFQAGAPDIVKAVDQLHLSQAQKVQVNDAIERADAGAAVLIHRENDVKEMIAATTPQDPMYAKLISEQAAEPGLWTENREALHRDVLAALSPAQRARFEELMASR
jgi:poly-gamma-glutamate capsule biosynthesis protein CapA/YwtB (metallophosphatase superfamily)